VPIFSDDFVNAHARMQVVQEVERLKRLRAALQNEEEPMDEDQSLARLKGALPSGHFHSYIAEALIQNLAMLGTSLLKNQIQCMACMGSK
jgi:hypothetical protein